MFAALRSCRMRTAVHVFTAGLMLSQKHHNVNGRRAWLAAITGVSSPLACLFHRVHSCSHRHGVAHASEGVFTRNAAFSGVRAFDYRRVVLSRNPVGSAGESVRAFTDELLDAQWSVCLECINAIRIVAFCVWHLTDVFFAAATGSVFALVRSWRVLWPMLCHTAINLPHHALAIML